MSLDVYVMPLWRFKAGDVTVAVQRLSGVRPRIVTLQGMLTPERVRGFFARRRAQREVRRIVAEAEKQLDVRLEWNDEGDVVYAEQALGFEAFRAFAKWLDLQDLFPQFDDPPEDNFYNHLAMLWKDGVRTFRFSHIIDHSCHSGYYVPCRFDRVVFVEPSQPFGGHLTFYQSIGSSFTLAEQLCELEQYIPSQGGSGGVSTKSGELIRFGFDMLKELSEKSLQHGLPIVFWG